MSVSQKKLDRLREAITENLRVQRDGESIEYINVGTAIQDACSKQNHTIFARRGCGKTLLLHSSSKKLPSNARAVYLNCEDFKRHSFPNVLIEILRAIFLELNRNLFGWFGKKKRSKEIIKEILSNLNKLQRAADVHDEEIRKRNSSEEAVQGQAGATFGVDALSLNIGTKDERRQKEEIERSFRIHKEKLEELDRWLPELKQKIRDFLTFPRLYPS